MQSTSSCDTWAGVDVLLVGILWNQMKTGWKLPLRKDSITWLLAWVIQKCCQKYQIGQKLPLHCSCVRGGACSNRGSFTPSIMLIRRGEAKPILPYWGKIQAFWSRRGAPESRFVPWMLALRSCVSCLPPCSPASATTFTSVITSPSEQPETGQILPFLALESIRLCVEQHGNQRRSPNNNWQIFCYGFGKPSSTGNHQN